MANREQVATDLAGTTEQQVQYDGDNHDEEDEPHDGQRRAVDARNVELGSHHDAEYQDEEHAQLEGLGDGAHLFAEGGDDGQGGDGEDDNELVDLSYDEERQSNANAQHQYGEQ